MTVCWRHQKTNQLKTEQKSSSKAFFSFRTLFFFCLMIGIGMFFCIQTGCQSALFTLAYMVKGNNDEAIFKEEIKEIPKGSKVVVICRSASKNIFGNDGPGRELSLLLEDLLKVGLKKNKFEWVSYELVSEKMDESDFQFESFAKMGQAVGADYVFGVNINTFSLYHSRSLYQGRSQMKVSIIKCSTNEIIAEESIPELVYPPNSPRDADTMQESVFQNAYIAEMAREICRYFCPHDRHEKYGKDSELSRTTF